MLEIELSVKSAKCLQTDNSIGSKNAYNTKTAWTLRMIITQNSLNYLPLRGALNSPITIINYCDVKADVCLVKLFILELKKLSYVSGNNQNRTNLFVFLRMDGGENEHHANNVHTIRTQLWKESKHHMVTNSHPVHGKPHKIAITE